MHLYDRSLCLAEIGEVYKDLLKNIKSFIPFLKVRMNIQQ